VAGASAMKTTTAETAVWCATVETTPMHGTAKAAGRCAIEAAMKTATETGLPPAGKSVCPPAMV